MLVANLKVDGRTYLERNSLGEELANTQRCRQDAQGEAHGVILICNEEEHSIDQDTPDSNIGNNASWQAGGIEDNGTIPVESNESPGQWSSDGWDVNVSRGSVVAEVEGGKIEEVDDQHNFGPDEVGANPQHNPGELKEVVEDEVASDGRSSIDVSLIIGEEGIDVSDLRDEEDEPLGMLVRGLPLCNWQ